MHVKSLEEKPVRESSNKTISTSDGIELLYESSTYIYKHTTKTN